MSFGDYTQPDGTVVPLGWVLYPNPLVAAIAPLVSEPREAGGHTVAWNGRSANGQAAPSGVYFAHLVTETGREYRRMLLLK